ncbi:M23 family metallopeptidase [Paenibacillus athensensis]|uniref:M23ase beta-sheet core domain-containing protein n=1 Tax=Paenibacillus athensensis TaxID=1967502 RepID=A0A4Y8PVX7_9BACL|nr:M23 family metallopeptidase [Paenibacillus athensensis]MCD1258213.1 M23 family metallopeptidase [Paenibacillus athensensis]
MQVKDTVKQRRMERLRLLREAGEAGGGPEWPGAGRGPGFGSVNGAGPAGGAATGPAAGMGAGRYGGSGSGSGITSSPLAPRPAGASDEEREPMTEDRARWQRRMEDPEFAWRYKYENDAVLNGRSSWFGGGAESDQDGPGGPSRRSALAVKLMVSLVLFAGVWGLFHVEQPWASAGRGWVTSALTEPFDYQTLSVWYAQRFGGSPSFIPSFRSRENGEAVKVNASKRTLFSPAKGVVSTPFDAGAHLGVLLQTAADAPVYALDTGQVVFAGVQEHTGFTIVIRHPGGLQSVYGWVSDSPVQTNDWIKGGEALGKASAGEAGKGKLYFAVTRDGKPANPTEVIAFD